MKYIFAQPAISAILGGVNRKREIVITALALFSLFFGAGNLILPPQLGFKA
ncbi:MAG: branched-chain amino acid transport system II carrier protein, partial [Flavobacteriaceae bacterium]